MNILIVYAHPSKKSYTYEILTQLQTDLTAQRWNVEISDLYATNFQSDMSEREYEREGLSAADMLIAEDVLQEHQKIERADCIIFLYPVWWSDCPAKLKGWFDRVYTAGYAYGHNATSKKMKSIPYGLVICTAGHPTDLLNETGISTSMQTIMLNDRLGKRFIHKEMLILGGTLQPDHARALHQTTIKDLPQRIIRHTIL